MLPRDPTYPGAIQIYGMIFTYTNCSFSFAAHAILHTFSVSIVSETFGFTSSMTLYGLHLRKKLTHLKVMIDTLNKTKISMCNIIHYV